ncbi:17319_t:CDS:2 [Entrophospora sp. SA101]|nr:17319_t:CDS:2 [Entrophospora sp. SA101]
MRKENNPLFDNGEQAPLKALIFDLLYNQYRGVIIYVRIFSGELKVKQKIKFFSNQKIYQVEKIGVKTPQEVEKDRLITEIRDTQAGDTIVDINTENPTPLPGYQKLKPNIYSNLYPNDSSEFNEFKKALLELQLQDSSLTLEGIESNILVHRRFAEERSRELCLRLKETLNPQNFAVPIQACLGQKDYEQISQEIQEYQLLKQETTGPENQNILEKEINVLEAKKTALIEEVKQELISQKGVKQNVLMEIRPGAGGVEAGLFARDLYRKEAFKCLKSEAGVHRVQRVPITENKGRLQTSTASVVVLPEVQDVAVKINQQDLKIETSRSGGAGGQHVNTTDSKVQITHLPTGIVATSQDGRSQHDNKEKALFILKSRLFEKYRQEQEKTIGNLRSLAIGTSERAEKIRTYNYPQNRVTDHRAGIS